MTTIHVPEQTINLNSGNSAIKLEIVPEVPIPIPSQRYPQGKGILIWNLDTNYVQTVDKLIGLGVKWVAPKVVNALNQYNANFINSFITECRKAGIDVWGWGYTFGVNAEGEGGATAKIINNLDISGFFIDAEGQYDVAGSNTFAGQYINALVRLNVGKKPLGLCSYRYPSVHGNFPWSTFLPFMDFHIPQVYWIQGVTDSTPGYQLGKSYAQLQALKHLPYIPIGTIVKDDNSAWVPTPAQVTNFGNTVKQMNLPGFGYYDLDSGIQNLLDVVKIQ
jgi:hypothetical protein